MSATPKVSVLIPAYNYAHFLDETIQSVLNQTFTDYELIVVDNCSTDNTDAVVAKYLTDSRVIFHKNKTNLGLVGNWNKCLELARGEYIKLLCADDKFHPEQLEKSVAVLDARPGVSLLTGYNEIFGTSSFCRILPFKEYVHAPVVIEDLLGPRNHLSNPSVAMFRKRDVERVGPFNPKLFQYTDREYYIRLLALGDCYIIPEPLCYIRSHPNTETSRIYSNVKKKGYSIIFERYWLMMSVKEARIPEKYGILSNIDAEIKSRATRCAAIIYELLPKLHKRTNRILLRQAYQIGSSHGVLLAPLSHYLQPKYITKFFKRK